MKIDAKKKLSEYEVEKMSRNPHAMYLHALKTHKRLPDRLHESMMLFSFDPEFGQCVKDYLMWHASCEERDRASSSQRRVELVAACSLLFAVFSYLSAFVFLVL